MMNEDNKKCIWMASGLISYKLCAFDYHCEDCMFDRAMRNEAVPENMHIACFPDAAAQPGNEKSMHIMDDVFYHSHHCWVKVESPDCARIGIDSILAGFINKIKTIVLPRPGEQVSQGQYFCHIIQHRHILPLISPLKGTINSVNNQLEKTPELIINNFWETGWLVTVKPEKLEHDLRSLIFGKKAVEWHKNKEHEMINTCNSLLNKAMDSPGLTMHDGGKIIPEFIDIINSEQYYQVLESLSRSEDSSS